MTTYTIDQYTKDAIDRLTDYVYEDEEKDFNNSKSPKNHIFQDIMVISGWLEEINTTGNTIWDEMEKAFPNGFISKLEHHKQYAQDNGIN